MIHLEGLTKFYGGQAVLQDINLKIPDGTICGIIGASGAGKSTLLRCINLLEAPDRGRVTVDGLDITSLSGAALRASRRKTGMIFQHFNLLSGRTVYDNIALPLELDGVSRKAREAIVRPLIEMTGLTDRTGHYPAQLSGGQKQRVAIARALAGKPGVLLCDEATSSLDPETTRSILELLKDINRRLGLTVVLITHEMEVVRSACDHVAVLEQGRIVEHDSTESIFLHPQQTVTKRFVGSITGEAQAAGFQEPLRPDPFSGGYPVVRISFTGKYTGMPLITRAARKFDVDFSILHGSIETVHETSMGFLLVHFTAEAQKQNDVFRYLEDQGLSLEIKGYA